ncbi:ABC transporter permease [Breznakiella homolactica]|uniref:ABC transporter permease n=1 Tax=Breznakiella homolactica TaxID=2798577 RepID=A0A7T7XKN6_9SPIR|nr:ABC transporter permease [Breznakiella homolactica]QQO08116.1 ABC transporter permease [Breznakiella homolactica]
MVKFILKRLIWMVPVVLGVTVFLFTLLYFVPGDPAVVILGANATQAELESKREDLGLNDPYLVRLSRYMVDAFLYFDFGKSYITNTSITSDLLIRFPRTFLLAFSCILLSIVVGVPLGVNAAVHQNGFADRACMFLALLGVSMPAFWVGLMLVLVFSLRLGWLPPSGIGGLQYYILPAIANSFGGIANQARQTRSSMLEVIRSDYITTARSKGLSERKVIYSHALPNALIPVITIAGSSFGRMLGGTLVIETVFSIPGIGSYMIGAVNNRDYPVVMGSVIFLAISFSMVMLLVDLIYAYVDPRIKAQYMSGSKRRRHHA